MKSGISATEYKEPSERISALGFASSILNGNTVEGGLRSLTYKSIFALKLVDEADLVKRCIVSDEPQLTRISDTDMTPDRVEKLRGEIQQLEAAQHKRSVAADEQIDHYSMRLDQELLAKTVSGAYSSDIKKLYLHLFPDVAISYGANGHVVRTIACPVKVERMEDAEGFDRSIYERARERKLEEERLKQQELEQERERKQLEQQAREQQAREQQAEQERLQAQQRQQQELQQQEIQRQQVTAAAGAAGSGQYPTATYDHSNGAPNGPAALPYNDDAMHLDADTPMAPGADLYSATPAAAYGADYTPGYTPSAFAPSADFTPTADYAMQDSPYLQTQSPY